MASRHDRCRLILIPGPSQAETHIHLPVILEYISKKINPYSVGGCPLQPRGALRAHRGQGAQGAQGAPEIISKVIKFSHIQDIDVIYITPNNI